MDKQISGDVTLDTYLVFDKAKVTAENDTLVGRNIDLDDYIYGFNRDLWGVSDFHAEATRSLNEYADALNEYVKNAIEQMFDSCTFDTYKTSYTSDVKVSSDGIATVRLSSGVQFNGMNPSLSKNEIEAIIKKRIDERHSGELAGIADALIAVITSVVID